MKRIIAFLTTITIIVSLLCGVMPVGADSSDDTFTDKVTLLSMLGIIDSVDVSSDSETAVTRAEFAKYVAAIMGLGDFSSNELDYFDDVPADHWAKDAVNALTQRGVISAASDRRFNPGAKITTHEALKMVLCAVGYGEYANIRGGYPTGYIFIARRLDITMKEESELTIYNAIQLLYSALMAPLYEQVVFTTDGRVSYEESAETLLSVNFGMYYMKGLVKSAEGLTIDSRGDEEEGFVRIGKATYKTDLKLLDQVGRYCGFIVKDNRDTFDEIVILNKEELKDNQLEIDTDDFLGYNNGVFSYYDAGDNRRSISINSGATVVRNGKVMDTSVSAAFAGLNKGSIRVIDENSDNNYDYVLIFNYRNMIAESISVDTGTVFSNSVYGAADASVTSPATVVLDPEKTEKKVVIRNANGKRMNFTDLSIGAVLSVCESDKFVLATVSTNEVTGTIFKTRTGYNNITEILLGKVETDAIWYRFDEDYYNVELAGGAKLAVGLQGKFYTDYRNTITSLKFTKASDWTYAYLVEYDEDTLFDTTLKFRLFTEDGKVGVYEAAKKVNVDGITKSGATAVLTALNKTGWLIPKTLGAGEDAVIGQLVRVKINKEGKITAIDTENRTLAEDAQTLNRNVKFENSGALTNQWYTNGFHNSSYSVNVLRNAETIVFSVPDHGDLAGAEDKYFIKLDAGWFRSGSFDVDTYKLDLGANYEDAIVVYGNPSQQGIKGTNAGAVERFSYVVEEAYTTLNTEGETVQCITAYSMGGMKYEFEAKAGYDFSMNYFMPTSEGATADMMTVTTTDGTTGAIAAPGDVIRIARNMFGEIIGGTIILDASRLNDPTYQLKTGTYDNIESDQYEAFWYGYVKSFKDGVIRMRRDLPDASEYTNDPHRNDYIGARKVGGVLIVEMKGSGAVKISEGTDGDIVAVKSLGAAAKPTLMCCGGVGFFTGAIIYR